MVDALDKYLLDKVATVVIEARDFEKTGSSLYVQFPSIPGAEQVSIMNRLLEIPGFSRMISHGDEKRDGFFPDRYFINVPKNHKAKDIALPIAELLKATGVNVKVVNHWGEPIATYIVGLEQ